MRKNKKLALPALAALLAASLGAQVEVQDPAKSKRAKPKKPVVFKLGTAVDAALKLKDIKGKEHSFGDLRGKVVFVHFWSTRCPAVVNSQDKLDAIHNDYKDKEVVVLGIDSNQNEIGAEPARPTEPKGKEKEKAPIAYAGLRKFTKRRNIRYPILVDHGNKVSELFQARVTPHCYVIDKKGIIRYAGALDNDPRGSKGEGAESYVRDTIDALLASKEVEPRSTSPYG